MDRPGRQVDNDLRCNGSGDETRVSRTPPRSAAHARIVHALLEERAIGYHNVDIGDYRIQYVKQLLELLA